jgi:hypothetical protein
MIDVFAFDFFVTCIIFSAAKRQTHCAAEKTATDKE